MCGEECEGGDGGEGRLERRVESRGFENRTRAKLTVIEIRDFALVFRHGDVEMPNVATELINNLC